MTAIGSSEMRAPAGRAAASLADVQHEGAQQATVGACWTWILSWLSVVQQVGAQQLMGETFLTNAEGYAARESTAA